MKNKAQKALAAQKTPDAKTDGLLRLPASRAHVWAFCGGSETIRGAANPFSFSDDARRGIVVHKVGALQLTQPKGKKPDSDLDIIEKQIYEAERDEIHDAVLFYQQVVESAFSEARERDPRAELHVEQVIRTTTDKYLIEGPPDAYILEPGEGRVTVFDLKSGFVEVDAENNAQLLVYAHAVARFHNLRAPSLHGVIVQPPLKQVAYADFTFDPEFFDRLKVDESRFTVGAHCSPCAVKTACATFGKRVKKYLGDEYKDATIDRLKAWPDLLDIAKPAEKFFADIQSQAFAYLSAGGKIDGWGLGTVAGRRTWTNETDADRLARAFKLRRDSFVEEKLASVKEVEGILKKAKVKNADTLSSFFYQPTAPRLKRTREDESFLSPAESGTPRKAKGKPKGKGGKKKVKTK